ncbi:MAG: hypothetical protein VX899_20890 [Myxococcota bacterium]|nr:hypothetical protein [Myxococcota bacterium]
MFPLLLIAANAQAAEAPIAPVSHLTQETAAPAAGTGEVSAAPQRPYLMEVNLRGKYMSVPDSFLDIFFFNESANNGNHLARPDVRAYAAGMEFAIRSNGMGSGAMGSFYFDYLGPLIEDGYWDDREDESSGANPDYNDGYWLAPSSNFGFVTLGANYYYDLRLAPWFSFIVGGGLGVAMTIGEIQRWGPTEDGTPAWNRDDLDSSEADRDPLPIPGAVPYWDLNFGLKFHFNDKASLRLEGGMHPLFYGGAAVGIVF